MDYRYFCLGGHYRSQLKFNFDSLSTARTARTNVYDRVQNLLKDGAKQVTLASEQALSYQRAFLEHIQNDLNTPRALADLWGVLKDDRLSSDEKYSLVLLFDQVFGLRLSSITAPEQETFPPEAEALLMKRVQAKKEKNWALADSLRSGSSLEKKM